MSRFFPLGLFSPMVLDAAALGLRHVGAPGGVRSFPPGHEYSGEELRYLRRLKGVGRPPKSPEEFKAFKAAKARYTAELRAGPA